MPLDSQNLIESICEENLLHAQKIAEFFCFCKKYIDIEIKDRIFHKHTFDLQQVQFVDAKTSSQSVAANFVLKKLHLASWLEASRGFSVCVLSFQDIFTLAMPPENNKPQNMLEFLASSIPLEPASIEYKEFQTQDGSFCLAFDKALLKSQSSTGKPPLCIISDLDIWKVFLEQLYWKLECTPLRHLSCKLVYPTCILEIAHEVDGMRTNKSKRGENSLNAKTQNLKSQSNLARLASLEISPSSLLNPQQLLMSIEKMHSRLFLSCALQAIRHICEEAARQ